MDNVLFRGDKAFCPSEFAIIIHVSQDTVTNMYIKGQVCYLSHWTTSFFGVNVFGLKTLYTKVVRFSFYQRPEPQRTEGKPVTRNLQPATMQ